MKGLSIWVFGQIGYDQETKGVCVRESSVSTTADLTARVGPMFIGLRHCVVMSMVHAS